MAGVAERTVPVRLSRDEADVLAASARYYERSWGFMRHIVRLTSGPEMRARYRFMADESYWLSRFAEHASERLSRTPAGTGTIPFTPRALVAFWARLLVGLSSARARRKMSAERIVLQESLASRLQEHVAKLAGAQPGVLEEELALRSEREARLITQRLQDGPEQPA